MQVTQDTCSLLLSLRKKANIKVRQPLQKALIPILDEEMRMLLMASESVIKSEVNIKQIEYLEADNTLIKKKVKANFKTLGARLGAQMKLAAAAIQGMTGADIQQLERDGQYLLVLGGNEVAIMLDDVEISSDDIPGLLVASKGPLTVALDITLTDDLVEEGIAREFVNKIQKIRKDSQFELTDRIPVKIIGGDLLKNALIRFNSYICAEILAESLVFSNDMLENSIEIEVNDTQLNVFISKI
jgi:isoleucyl-tRNA synthetase